MRRTFRTIGGQYPSMDYRGFANRLRSCNDPWALMYDVQVEWDVPRSGAKVYSIEEIEAAESRLGFSLPKTLRDWYQLAWNPWFLTTLTCTVHEQPQPRKSRFANGLRVFPKDAGENGLVVFIADYQCCWECGFRVRDAHLDDPPVCIGRTFDDDYNETPLDEWEQHGDSLTSFMLQLLLGSLATDHPLLLA